MSAKRHNLLASHHLGQKKNEGGLRAFPFGDFSMGSAISDRTQAIQLAGRLDRGPDRYIYARVVGNSYQMPRPVSIPMCSRVKLMNMHPKEILSLN